MAEALTNLIERHPALRHYLASDAAGQSLTREYQDSLAQPVGQYMHEGHKAFALNQSLVELHANVKLLRGLMQRDEQYEEWVTPVDMDLTAALQNLSKSTLLFNGYWKAIEEGNASKAHDTMQRLKNQFPQTSAAIDKLLHSDNNVQMENRSDQVVVNGFIVQSLRPYIHKLMEETDCALATFSQTRGEPTDAYVRKPDSTVRKPGFHEDDAEIIDRAVADPSSNVFRFCDKGGKGRG